MPASAWISSLTFSDGTTIHLSSNEIIVLVGSNNVGKSVALKEIQDLFPNPGAQAGKVVNSIEIGKTGSPEEALEWIRENCDTSDGQTFSRLNHNISENEILGNHWEVLGRPQGHHHFGPFFLTHLNTESRLNGSNSVPSLDFSRQKPSNPVHQMYLNEEDETKICQEFHAAFGTSLLLNRLGGTEISLHLGERPPLDEGEQPLAVSYQRKIRELPQLKNQGDGMRSFTTCLLYINLLDYFITLIDEPEAFLHPPQATLMGRMLANDKSDQRQLFISTHSGDLLRGMLNTESNNIRVIRIRRDEEVNPAKELTPESVREVWKDPILRYLNVLDGLFHESVVVCEGDSDCKFCSAITDAILNEQAETKDPDIMFIHCGGKHRIPTIIKALKNLEVPLKVIADFDILNEEQPLRSLFEILGGDWATISGDWNVLDAAIKDKRPELNAEETKRGIRNILDEVVSENFPEDAIKEIRNIGRRISPWKEAKRIGIAYVPPAQAHESCIRVIEALKELGIFVVPIGTLESFCRSVGNHGPEWANEVLQKNLNTDPELEQAREFVREAIL